MNWDQTPNLRLKDINDVWMHMTSLGLILTCPQCLQRHEQIQQTFCGLAFGLIDCPHCQFTTKVTPEIFQEITDEWILDMSEDESYQVNQDVASVVENWHQSEPWRKILAYKGTNLGEPGERELACHINAAFCLRQPEEINRG